MLDKYVASGTTKRQGQDTVCCATLGTEVPGHHQEKLSQTSIFRNALVFLVPKIRGPRPHLAPLSDPPAAIVC